MKDNIIFFLVGIIIGMTLSIGGGFVILKVVKGDAVAGLNLPSFSLSGLFGGGSQLEEFAFSFEDGKVKPLSPEDGAAVEVVATHASDGAQALLLNLPSGHKFPGLLWEVYGRDVLSWGGKRTLKMDIYNNSEKYVPLEIKLKSGKDYPKKSFLYKIELSPLKKNAVSINLDAVAAKCDLTQMSYFKLFANSPQYNSVLYIDNIRIE